METGLEGILIQDFTELHKLRRGVAIGLPGMREKVCGIPIAGCGKLNVRFTNKAVWAAIATFLVVGLAIALGVGIGIVKLWLAAREWAQIALGAGDFAAAPRVVAQAAAVLGDDRIARLSRTGKGMLLLSAAAANPELAEVQKWTAAMPALGPLLQNGSYQKALEEAVRQNASNIAQIRLDQVASPEVRAVRAQVLQVVAKSPQGAEAASTVSANVLNMLRSEAFAPHCQNPEFSRFLSGAAPARETE